MNILRAVGLGRLTQAADWLLKHQTTLEGRFNLTIWRADNSDLEEELSTLVEHDELQNECCTSACVVGWLTTDPEFQKQGLKMGVSPVYDPKHLFPVNAQPTEIFLTVRNWEQHGYPPEAHRSLVKESAAVLEFFQLTPEEFMELFMDVSYQTSPTVTMVANRIQQFVEQECLK